MGCMTVNATGDRAGGRPTDRPALRLPANRVARRAVWYWFTRASIGWCLVLAVQILALILEWPLPPAKIALLVATVVLAAIHVSVMPLWRYRVHRWELTDLAVYTRTGWWNQEWRIAPLTRVQTVDNSRGPLARIFGLTELVVTTASAAGPLKIEGLDANVALQLAAAITAATGSSGDDAT